MILRIEDAGRTGPALDARDLDVDPEVLLDAIRDPDDDRIGCPPPGPVHGHLERITPTTTLARPTTALAAAARSRGATTELDGEIEAVASELDELELPSADVSRAVQTVSEAASEVEAHRDRVARLGGIVAARDDIPRDADAETDARNDAVADARTDLRSAAAELAEAETAHQAARQELARERARQREANDVRERRLRLQDRLENLRRAARRALAAREHARIERALDAIPAWPGATADARRRLALTRGSYVRAPVIVVDGPFRTPCQARACLAAPVILA